MIKHITIYKKEPVQLKNWTVRVVSVKTIESKLKTCKNHNSSQFPSAELALHAIMNDYNRTYDSSDSMTTRAGVLLSALLAAFMISLSSIDFKFIFKPVGPTMCNPLYYLLILVVFLHITSAIISFVFLILSVLTMTFQGLNCDHINNDKCLSYANDKVARSLIDAYHASIKENDKNNKIRSIRYKVGSWIGASSIILYLCTILIQNIVK